MAGVRPPASPHQERAPPPSPVRTRQSECLGPVQPAAHCSWQQSVASVPLQRGQPWQMLLVTAGGGGGKREGYGGDGDPDGSPSPQRMWGSPG